MIKSKSTNLRTCYFDTGNRHEFPRGVSINQEWNSLHEQKVRGAQNKIAERLKQIVKKIFGKLPAVDGPFGTGIECGKLTKQIGGQNDTNKDITRRILFLTEGMPVGARSLFDEQRQQLIARYLQDEMTDHQLALFFLNDVIRYWRTICVDFENKTYEQKKDWGIRNIKLVFSRKLLYFGGILIAAETAQRSLLEKREIFARLMELTPLERLITCCGRASERCLLEYDHFLEKIADSSFRDRLRTVKLARDTHTEEFKRLKNRGHYFSYHLISALRTTYSESHPIHRSIIM
jgi:hypothetical protein